MSRELVRIALTGLTLAVLLILAGLSAAGSDPPPDTAPVEPGDMGTGPGIPEAETSGGCGCEGDCSMPVPPPCPDVPPPEESGAGE